MNSNQGGQGGLGSQGPTNQDFSLSQRYRAASKSQSILRTASSASNGSDGNGQLSGRNSFNGNYPVEGNGNQLDASRRASIGSYTSDSGRGGGGAFPLRDSGIGGNGLGLGVNDSRGESHFGLGGSNEPMFGDNGTGSRRPCGERSMLLSSPSIGGSYSGGSYNNQQDHMLQNSATEQRERYDPNRGIKERENSHLGLFSSSPSQHAVFDSLSSPYDNDSRPDTRHNNTNNASRTNSLLRSLSSQSPQLFQSQQQQQHQSDSQGQNFLNFRRSEQREQDPPPRLNGSINSPKFDPSKWV